MNRRPSVEVQRDEHRDLVAAERAALPKGNHHLTHDIAVRQIESRRERIVDALLGAMSRPFAAYVLTSSPQGHTIKGGGPCLHHRPSGG